MNSTRHNFNPGTLVQGMLPYRAYCEDLGKWIRIPPEALCVYLKSYTDTDGYNHDIVFYDNKTLELIDGKLEKAKP